MFSIHPLEVDERKKLFFPWKDSQSSAASVFLLLTGLHMFSAEPAPSPSLRLSVSVCSVIPHKIREIHILEEPE